MHKVLRQIMDRCKNLLAKATTVYDVASNCLTLAYKQNKNNYYILKL